MKNKAIILLLLIVSINTAYAQDVFRLLDLPKGYPLWKQTKNNDGGSSYDKCDPSYNELTPSTNVYENCYHSPLGCGAIAMGQIMYYWEWPLNYNWSNIPFELLHTTPYNKYTEIQNLLYDCAESMEMKYHDDYSYAFTTDVLNGFHNMGYNSATIYKQDDWSLTTWRKIIKTELDLGRPVFIRGGRPIFDWWNIHYFVIDGYDRNNPNLFHFNFGWGNNANSDIEHTFEIDDITMSSTEGGEDDYSHNQQIIIGISPTCNATYPHNITTVPYSQVFSNMSEVAFNNISLPSTNHTLTVENNGELILTAGNKITLKPGFKANTGSYFLARIRNINGCDCGGNLSVSSWTNIFTPFNNDGYNDNLCIPVINANSFTIQVFNRDGVIIFEDAGIVNNNQPCVWNGQGLYNSGYFSPHGNDYIRTTVLAIIRFFNNCGQKIENAYWVTAVIPRTSKKNIQVDSYNYEDKCFSNPPIIYPNPTKDILFFRNVSFNNEKIKVTIQSILGNKIIEKEIFDNQIDISELSSGVYILILRINSKLYNYKIIKK